MSNTTIPGMKGVHRWITDDCIAGKGVEGSIDEALQSAREFLDNAIPRWETTPGARFHVVVTVEPPAEREGTSERVGT